MNTASFFARGSAVYTCNCCKRSTRSTGRGDNDNVGLCAECFDLSGEENSLSDTGDLYDSPERVLEMIMAVKKLGGDATVWGDLALIAARKRDAANCGRNQVFTPDTCSL